jgi:hypothetical protein
MLTRFPVDSALTKHGYADQEIARTKFVEASLAK